MTRLGIGHVSAQVKRKGHISMNHKVAAILGQGFPEVVFGRKRG
jgi:hypothetical protein